MMPLADLWCYLVVLWLLVLQQLCIDVLRNSFISSGYSLPSHFNKCFIDAVLFAWPNIDIKL